MIERNIIEFVETSELTLHKWEYLFMPEYGAGWKTITQEQAESDLTPNVVSLLQENHKMTVGIKAGIYSAEMVQS